MGEITGLRGNLEVKIQKLSLDSQGLVTSKSEGIMALKKYVLRIYYDPEQNEIVELSESFSDKDEYKIVIDGNELDLPEEMQEYLEGINIYDIGIC